MYQPYDAILSELTRETLNVRFLTLSRQSLVSLRTCYAKGLLSLAGIGSSGFQPERP
jgi:hypothetical protein